MSRGKERGEKVPIILDFMIGKGKEKGLLGDVGSAKKY